MFQLRFADGGELVLTEAGKKKRAGVWIVTPAQLDEDLAHLGPDALDVDGAGTLAQILVRERRQLHPLLRDQRALAGVGRAHANEILWEARLSPFRLSTDLGDDEVDTLATTIRENLARALELRIAGKGDDVVYRVHGRFGEPCPRCGETLRRVDFEEHTIHVLPGRARRARRASSRTAASRASCADISGASRAKGSKLQLVTCAHGCRLSSRRRHAGLCAARRGSLLAPA